jgi:hypothetical protein
VSHPGFPPPASATYPVAPLRRPATLKLGYLGALLVALFSAAGAVLLIVKARDVAEQTATDVLGADSTSELGSDLISIAVDEAASTLVSRGVAALVSALLVLGVALAVRNGALWARIVLTILVLGGICANGLVLSDIAPAATKALGVAAIVLSVAVVVLLFLPPTNAYARARKLGVR